MMMNNTSLMNEDSHRIPQDLFTETAPYYRFGWVKVLWCDKDYEADENDDDNDNKEIVKVDLDNQGQNHGDQWKFTSIILHPDLAF